MIGAGFYVDDRRSLYFNVEFLTANGLLDTDENETGRVGPSGARFRCNRHYPIDGRMIGVRPKVTQIIEFLAIEGRRATRTNG